MIGTEYFVRGTEPDETCHLHVGRSIFGRLAGWLGDEPRGQVTEQRAGDHAAAEAPAAVAPASPTRQAEDVPPRRRRSRRSAASGRACSGVATRTTKTKTKKKKRRRDPPDNRRRR